MNPSDLASHLRSIASQIDNTEQPKKKAVARRIKAALKLAVGADKRFVEYVRDFDTGEGLVHDIISGLNEANEEFLKSEGYNSLSSLEEDDSQKGKEVFKTWEILRKQADIISDALRATLPELVQLDSEL